MQGDKIRITFDHTGSGLKPKDGNTLKGFAIAGSDQKFVWAEAKIEKNTVVVWSDQVAAPQHVRYAWAVNPIGNLCNREGLPASPFPTDKWKAKTKLTW